MKSRSHETKMEDDVKKWLQEKVDAFLRRLGLRQGQTVLDFGCNEGNYTIASARVVGESGKVYALEKNKDSLDKLMQKAQKARLRNIEPLHVKEDQKPPLPSRCVDVVLLYDALHRGYFPEKAQRERVLRRIHRVLKPGGLLSCYPTHLKKYGITFSEIVGEITNIGFCFQHEHRRALIHDGRLVQGRILSFIRPPAAGQPSRRSHRKHRG